MEIVKKTEPILNQILQTEKPSERAAVLFQRVKESKQPLTLITVDHENFPTINRIIAEAGEPSVKIFLVMLIEDCVRSLNINEPTKDQVLEIADELIRDFPYFKPEDFRIFFLNFKKGKYGKDYHRFDLSVVYRALDLYLPERSEAHEIAVQNQKSIQSSAVRTGEADMKTLYDQVVEGELKSQARKERIEELKKAAVDEWNQQMREAAERDGVDPEENKGDNKWFKQYLAKYPLTESYINFYIKKHLK